LRRLSLMLQEGNLVRKYDPLFMALQLDDRFISDNEFWGAIHEHPTLINGPVLANGTHARVCRPADSVETLLAEMASGSVAAPKPKVLSDRLLQMVAGNAVPPRAIEKPVEKVQPAEKAVDEKPAPMAKAPAPVKAAPVVEKAKAKAPTKAVAKPAAKAKPAKADRARNFRRPSCVSRMPGKIDPGAPLFQNRICKLAFPISTVFRSYPT
jgi:hypothetical protein